MSNSKSRILFFLSGSIAAFKACQAISRLVQDGHEVQTVATPGALKFVGPATLEGLTGKPVLSDLWENGRAMDHIHLSRWADFGVLCPASANTIARLAQGMADDLLSALVLAWPKGKPLHVFPAMNVEMFNSSITQKNLRALSDAGLNIHNTQSGNLACGETGAGRLLEPEDILSRIFAKQASRGKVLITGGATREPIDGIRFISNVSTGQTASRLANELTRQGWSVTYLHGQGALTPDGVSEKLDFSSSADLNRKLRQKLGAENYSAVIHAAAVSDYTVAGANGQTVTSDLKLSSKGELNLQLERNAKILPNLREYSRNKNIRVVGFKLTLNSDETESREKARALLGNGVDAVVANDWSQVHADRSRHPGTLLRGDSETAFGDLPALAEQLNSYFSEGASHGSMS